MSFYTEKELEELDKKNDEAIKNGELYSHKEVFEELEKKMNKRRECIN